MEQKTILETLIVLICQRSLDSSVFQLETNAFRLYKPASRIKSITRLEASFS